MELKEAREETDVAEVEDVEALFDELESTSD